MCSSYATAHCSDVTIGGVGAPNPSAKCTCPRRYRNLSNLCLSNVFTGFLQQWHVVSDKNITSMHQHHTMCSLCISAYCSEVTIGGIGVPEPSGAIFHFIRHRIHPLSSLRTAMSLKRGQCAFSNERSASGSNFAGRYCKSISVTRGRQCRSI